MFYLTIVAQTFQLRSLLSRYFGRRLCFLNRSPAHNAKNRVIGSNTSIGLRQSWVVPKITVPTAIEMAHTTSKTKSPKVIPDDGCFCGVSWSELSGCCGSLIRPTVQVDGKIKKIQPPRRLHVHAGCGHDYGRIVRRQRNLCASIPAQNFGAR